jgi:hypothetical protein
MNDEARDLIMIPVFFASLYAFAEFTKPSEAERTERIREEKTRQQLQFACVDTQTFQGPAFDWSSPECQH